MLGTQSVIDGCEDWRDGRANRFIVEEFHKIGEGGVFRSADC